MRFWTAHLRPYSPPVLVREGFSWGALFFGPIWLAAHRAWIPAVISLALFVLIAALLPGRIMFLLLAALAVLLGMFGHDLRRWSLTHRRYLLAQVVAARDEAEAFARLLERRPDLRSSFMPPERA